MFELIASWCHARKVVVHWQCDRALKQLCVTSYYLATTTWGPQYALRPTTWQTFPQQTDRAHSSGLHLEGQEGLFGDIHKPQRMSGRGVLALRSGYVPGIVDTARTSIFNELQKAELTEDHGSVVSDQGTPFQTLGWSSRKSRNSEQQLTATAQRHQQSGTNNNIVQGDVEGRTSSSPEPVT